MMKTHAAHGFSPFLIMFDSNQMISLIIRSIRNRLMNKILRSIQAKELVEKNRLEAFDNIRFKQKEVQDKRSNVLIGDLAPGPLVMLKNEGILSKLEPLQHGRHFVQGQTSEGNYILENEMGQRLKDTYPLKKLRPYVEHEEDNEPHEEIEKIIERRINKENNRIEYLVKWKNFGDETMNGYLKTSSTTSR